MVLCTNQPNNCSPLLSDSDLPIRLVPEFYQYLLKILVFRGLSGEHRYRTRSPPIGGAGKTSRHKNSTESRMKRHFLPFFSNFEKCRPDVADDIISGVAVEQVGMDVRVKIGDSV